jgi:fructose-1,6-bisphosphatase II
LISDGDIAAAIEVSKAGAPCDIMLGIGGTPEGVIAACALKCMGGTLLGRLWPRNDEERDKAVEKGYDLNKELTIHDLVKGDDIFFAATGVTDGDLLKGVRYFSGGASTNSIVMRGKSGTVRFIETFHKWKPSNVSDQENGTTSLKVPVTVHTIGNGRQW